MNDCPPAKVPSDEGLPGLKETRVRTSLRAKWATWRSKIPVCWACLGRAGIGALIGWLLFLTGVSGSIVWDNREVYQEINKFKVSSEFEKHLAELNISYENSVHQPFIFSWLLSIIPNSANCGLKAESITHALACPVLKLLPYPTTGAIAVVDARGNRTIRVNRLADWNEIRRPLNTESFPTVKMISWATWHELGHHYQREAAKATHPWFDPAQTHLFGLYKESHADIFAIVSMGQEPGMTKVELHKVIYAIYIIRKFRAKQDPVHASDEFLMCLTVDEYLTKEAIVPAAQRLFEMALQRKATGKCFNNPPEPAVGMT